MGRGIPPGDCRFLNSAREGQNVSKCAKNNYVLLEGSYMHGHSAQMIRLTMLAFVLLLSGCTSTQFLIANGPTEFDRVDRHADLAYGQDPRQHLDIYGPISGPRQAARRPVVIFWYGGSWVKGNKAEYRFVGTTLAERGFVAVLPDYRLYPQATFPAFDEDGARAGGW